MGNEAKCYVCQKPGFSEKLAHTPSDEGYFRCTCVGDCNGEYIIEGELAAGFSSRTEGDPVRARLSKSISNHWETLGVPLVLSRHDWEDKMI